MKDPVTREALQAFVTRHLTAGGYYEEPLIRIGRADDPLWEEFKKPGAIGSIYRTPLEWLPEAKTVISVFGPWADEVVTTNAADPVYPSDAWIDAYHNGGALIKQVSVTLAEWLNKAGYAAMAPAMSKEFRFVYEDGSQPDIPAGIAYASNWSERHAAFVCGQGSFGLSRGIITRRGMAGRFCSVVTDLELEPDARPYTDVYEYCIMCGKCAENCPPRAISMEKGKEHTPCNAWLTEMKARNGIAGCCGKCQVNVPCSRGIPNR